MNRLACPVIIAIGLGAAGSTGAVPAGLPHYIERNYTAHERDLLRSAYGIDQPQWLYLSDSSQAAILKYDTQEKRCERCYVDSYRVGFLSLRRVGEPWTSFEARVRAMRQSDFPSSARRTNSSIDELDPAARTAFAGLIEAGRRAGFRLSIGETYRTPAREAALFETGRGKTYTATSMHSYGLAVDIIVDDGRPGRPTTRADWIRFRRFVAAQPGGRFRLIGAADQTWDWPHVELLSPRIGFHSVDEALAFAARCTTDSARAHAPGSAQLGGAASDPCVFIPNLAPGALP